MITEYQIVYWRDIPAQIKVRAGREHLSRPLAHRFAVAIDAAAMRAGLMASEAYLTCWRNSQWRKRTGNPAEVAAALANEIEASYPRARVHHLTAHGGQEAESES